METQVLIEKDELLGEGKWKTTTVTVKEFTPVGVRIEYNMEGDITGRINGHSIGTVNGLIRPDGSSEYEGRAITTTLDGDVVLVTAKGKGRAGGPIVRSESEDSFITSSSKLAWLNNTKGHSEVTYNRLTGEGHSKCYAK